LTPKMKKVLGTFTKTIKQLEDIIDTHTTNMALYDQEIDYLEARKVASENEMEQASIIKKNIEGIIS